MTTRTSAEWLEALRGADIPATPVQSVDDIIDDPHLAESGFFTMTDHPTEGRLRLMATPVTWEGMPPEPPRPAPRLGEHSAEILREAGYSDGEIDRMIGSRVTAVPKN